ncbi:MAG: perosamine synthetase [Alphaproteobacteria bacterium 41-28]|nr:MAG: perosamine synthetase [Alphaproteobacteria bacterium 41-28]
MIPIYKPYLKNREKEYVNRCLDSTWISSKGEFIDKFEKQFGLFIGSPHVTTVCNGTVAIHLALTALGIGPGDEVIVPTLTYVASVNTIVQTGATPVFVDSVESTLQMDADDVLRKITSRTKAVMAVHLYGLPCDMGRLVNICKDHQLYLIEDCAEAFGSFYRQQHVGTLGDIATFSFFGNKTITTGEGGMVVAKTKNLIDKVFHLKTQGVSKTREYWHDIVAYNYRMTNICAAIGLAQIEKADEILAKKRQIAQWYKQNLKDFPLTFHDELPDTQHSFWMCTMLLDSSEHRDALREYLQQNGIETRPLFPPCHTFPHLFIDRSYPVAESLSQRGINFPSYPDLEFEEISMICETIKKYFNGSR